MTNNTGKNNGEVQIIPDKYRILNGSWLKLIAVVTMLIDHVASVLLRDCGITLISIAGRSLSLYQAMRYVGRLAFPIYAFLLIEGFLHTSDRKKYGINLFVFALISEIPWNLEHSGGLLYSEQNIFFTLFLGYMAICVVERFRGKKQVGYLLMLLLITILIRADYGCAGFGFIILLYVLRDHKLLRAVIGSCILPSNWIAGLAFVPISLYNGKRGFIRGKFMKYAFYAFYPAHLLVLFLIKFSLGGY